MCRQLKGGGMEIYMDQQKIGVFIARRRKELNLTQKELADKLGITDRAVSKWENGRCMPDLSLLQPLSRILGVGVNDLLSGEIIPEEKVREKSERNIMNAADMASLKYLGSIRTGMAGLLSLFVLLLIYCGVKGLEATGLMALICTFNGFFYCSRYRAMRSQQLLAFGIVWILTAVVNLIAFFMRTW